MRNQKDVELFEKFLNLHIQGRQTDAHQILASIVSPVIRHRASQIAFEVDHEKDSCQWTLPPKNKKLVQ